MRWFRSHRQAWVQAALVALLLQFGLSFGHVHALHADEAAISAPAGEPHQPGQPASHDDEHCPIYQMLALLGGVQTAHAPAVAPPAPQAIGRVLARREAAETGADCAGFRSRAPPQS
jgi:hypothetical protein